VVYFVGIDGARFKRPVVPGDQLRMEAQVLRVTRGIWKFAVKGTVDGQTACEAELMCTLKDLA
jgi:3-hydroxyacyl-[acyl-carrier-protein] dehydratase